MFFCLFFWGELSNSQIKPQRQCIYLCLLRPVSAGFKHFLETAHLELLREDWQKLTETTGAAETRLCGLLNVFSDMNRHPYTLKTIWECHKAMAKVYCFEVKVVFLIQNLLALVTSTVSWQRNGWRPVYYYYVWFIPFLDEQTDNLTRVNTGRTEQPLNNHTFLKITHSCASKRTKMLFYSEDKKCK